MDSGTVCGSFVICDSLNALLHVPWIVVFVIEIL